MVMLGTNARESKMPQTNLDTLGKKWPLKERPFSLTKIAKMHLHYDIGWRLREPPILFSLNGLGLFP